MEGPFSSPPFPNFRLSPLGLVPKKESGCYRLIHHLSFPAKQSLNDDIDKSVSSVEYASFDNALSLLQRFGQGSCLAKVDIKSAFRLLPVCASGYNSLGFQFQGSFYFDKALPMGFSLSCFYFEAFSSFIEWVVSRQVVGGGILHYLDDFLFVGPRDSVHCVMMMKAFFVVAEIFGIPFAREKTIYPCTCIEFLGITIDSELMEFRLPQEKLFRICGEITRMLSVKKVTLRELQSLLGMLVFACRVIPVGRIFSRRLYMVTKGMVSPFSHIRLTRYLKDDLLVWLSFLQSFNGRAVWQTSLSAEEFGLFTDASGSVGFGAFWNNHWSAGNWHQSWLDGGVTRNLVLLELFPVVLAEVVWGQFFRDSRLLINTDNTGVVFAINCLSSKNVMVVKLLRHLVLVCLKLNIWIRARHVPGIHNDVADALSRWSVFGSWCRRPMWKGPNVQIICGA